jgi:hypothetical protein
MTLRASKGVAPASGVGFSGPPLDRQARAALEAAGIRLLQRKPIAAWCGQLQEYVVSVPSSDPEEAIAIVRSVVTGQGSYEGFAAITRPL